MRLYLDASAIIYLVEGETNRRRQVAERIAAANDAGDGVVLTSDLSRIECRVKPIRTNDLSLLADYDGVLEGSRIQIVPISRMIVDEATRVRAEHGFRVPDAIHLATAATAAADVLLTGDRGMARFPGLRVELVG